MLIGPWATKPTISLSRDIFSLKNFRLYLKEQSVSEQALCPGSEVLGHWWKQACGEIFRSPFSYRKMYLQIESRTNFSNLPFLSSVLEILVPNEANMISHLFCLIPHIQQTHSNNSNATTTDTLSWNSFPPVILGDRVYLICDIEWNYLF